jgi:nitroimidazol reductase NimA-like FMN-containing flavoprotein (pyridoxamine 5'-phosphate oxidase superfamily)
MVIREMSREECLRVLAGARLARLACAHENQPYVVPVYLAYHEASECLYGFTTPGQKVEWMRANPLVCVEVDEIAAHDQWVSVIALGRYEELPETTVSDCARLQGPERPRNVGEAMPAWSADRHHRQCDDEGCDNERERAWQVFQTHPMWWEPGLTAWAARTHRNSAEAFIPVYYRIRIDRITGHEATPDAKNAISYAVPTPPAERWGWLGKTLSRVFRGRSKEAGSVS